MTAPTQWTTMQSQGPLRPDISPRLAESRGEIESGGQEGSLLAQVEVCRLFLDDPFGWKGVKMF